MKNTFRWAQKINSSTLAYLYYSYDFFSTICGIFTGF